MPRPRELGSARPGAAEASWRAAMQDRRRARHGPLSRRRDRPSAARRGRRQRRSGSVSLPRRRPELQARRRQRGDLVPAAHDRAARPRSGARYPGRCDRGVGLGAPAEGQQLEQVGIGADQRIQHRGLSGVGRPHGRGSRPMRCIDIASVHKRCFLDLPVRISHMSSTRLPSLNALRAFEAAARHGSLSQAAAELHVTHSADQPPDQGAGSGTGGAAVPAGRPRRRGQCGGPAARGCAERRLRPHRASGAAGAAAATAPASSPSASSRPSPCAGWCCGSGAFVPPTRRSTCACRPPASSPIFHARMSTPRSAMAAAAGPASKRSG